MGRPLGVIRTALFAPADVPRRLERAWTSGADAVVVDLEDSVAPAAKDAARAALPATLAAREARAIDGPLALVRVNAPSTPDGERDLAALATLELDAVVVPKADEAALGRAAALGVPLVALVESAAGVLRADVLAALPRVAQLMFGPVDLVAELGCEPSPAGAELLYARSRLVLAAAAAGLPRPIDGPCLSVDDAEATRAEALIARRLGFGGKACIHPRQIAPVADAFAPLPHELAWARRVVGAHAAADAAGRGVLVVDGRMVDAPVVRRAHEILDTSGGTA